MKKLILGVALASFVISCKKIQAGSNHGILKMEDDSDRYTNDEMKGEEMEVKKVEAKSTAEIKPLDSANMTEINDAPAKMEKMEMIEPTLQSPLRAKQ